MSKAFDIICGVIKHRINEKDKAMMMLVVGEMGSGKSLAAVSFASKIDPSFRDAVLKGEKRIVFDVHDFLEVLNKTKKGQCIIFDEVGVNVAARDFQKLNNRIMSIITQILRYKNVCCIFTTPNARFVDINIRESMNAWVHPLKIDTEHNINTCRYKQLITDDEGLVRKQKFVYYDGKHGAAGEVMDPVHVPRPDTELEAYYKKMSFKMKDEKLKELQYGLDEDNANPMKVQSVVNRATACINFITGLRQTMSWDELAALSGFDKRALQRWIKESAESTPVTTKKKRIVITKKKREAAAARQSGILK